MLIWHGLARALQAFQTAKEFYHGIGGLLFEEDLDLLSHAARIVTASEYEQQAEMDDDSNLRYFTSRTRSQLVEAERKLLDNPMWLRFGKRNSESGMHLANIRKLAMGVFGGLALLVPMMIMVLNPTKLTALITTIVCVFFVAVIFSLFMDGAQPKDVFAAIAAYAAVLVVFVGTNTTNTRENVRVVGAISGGLLGGIVLLLALWFGTFHYLFSRREKQKKSKIVSQPLYSI